MRTKTTTFCFGRLNLVYGAKDRNELLVSALESSGAVEIRGQNWGFYDSAKIDDSEQFLTGYLVKYKPQSEEEIAVPEKQTLAEDLVENRVTAKSRFYLHARTGIIAYHPVGGEITIDGFRDRFARVLQHALGNFFVRAEVQPISDDLKLLSELTKFKDVRNVSISLHPSNPSSRDIWKKQDERLRDLGATHYVERYQGDPDQGNGLDIAADIEIRAKITMAADGYGKASVTGTLDNHVQTVSTKSLPVMVILDNYDEKYGDQVLPELRERFVELMRRFTQ